MLALAKDSIAQRRYRAEEFATRWKYRGQEKSDAQSFWTDLLRSVFRHETPETTALFEQGTEYGGWIDAVIPAARTFVEMKSRGKDLDARQLHRGKRVNAFEQAYEYVGEVPGNQRPRYIVTSNFEIMRIYDLDEPRAAEKYEEFAVAKLADHVQQLLFLDSGVSERTKHETRVTWTAGETIAKIYKLLRAQYLNPDSAQAQHQLNVLLVRIVFCLYAEDALVFPKNSFYTFLKGKTPTDARSSLLRLFEALNLPVEERDPYDVEVKAFPYVNGGLFQEPSVIPELTEEILETLVNEAAGATDWSMISPTIFGGVFESTLNPETRKKGGMHYTSPENIHRLIDPLFLDDLEQELDNIINMRGELEGKTHVAQRNAFVRFQHKIGSLTFFDPAAGSGNFLTETYICLRRLENVVLTHLQGGQSMMGLDDVSESPIKVSLRQFHGIEINDFAVSVAQTAMWIAELQANQETAMIVARTIDDLPLRDSVNMVRGNALEIDWNSIVPAEECDYIIGNPPFITGDDLSEQQKQERTALFGENAGALDYVACWFILAARYTEDTNCECALVATSSICQGQQVPALWQPMYNTGVRINFAHRAFSWANETRNMASVHVVIVGFAHKVRDGRWIFYPEFEGTDEYKQPVGNINPYLLDAPDAFVKRQRAARKDLPRMSKGFQPTDDGNLLIDQETYDTEVARDPSITKYIRRFTQARQYIEGTPAYIIWVSDYDLPDIARHPFLDKRIKSTAEFRSHKDRPVKGDAYKLKDCPHRPRPANAFVDNKDYLLVPLHTSHRRRYVPIGFVEKAEMIPGNGVGFVPTEDKALFGLLVSRLLTLWLDMTGGRLRADYRFGTDTVYNTLPVARFTNEDSNRIKKCAEAVLAERQELASRGKSLEMMYKPGDELYYPNLFKAHQELDRAVYAAYGLPADISEKDVQVFLFNEYLKGDKLKVTKKKKLTKKATNTKA